MFRKVFVLVVVSFPLAFLSGCGSSGRTNAVSGGGCPDGAMEAYTDVMQTCQSGSNEVCKSAGEDFLAEFPALSCRENQEFDFSSEGSMAASSASIENVLNSLEEEE